jgi:L-lactate dehydrogenase (cytochrome)
MPCILAPVGLAGAFGRRGETQVVRAAEAMGVPFCLSTVSICSMEEVAAVASKAFWYQLYMIRDRQVVTHLIQRARAVGVDTLMMTVDLPFPGARYRDTRNALSGARGLKANLIRAMDFARHPSWVYDVAIKGKPLVFGNLVDEVKQANSMADLAAWISEQFDPTVTWDDLTWVRDQWQGKLIIKGIMDSEDAEHAIKLGVDGIVVSNHGGRQLDSVPATIDALGGILDTVNGRIPVLVDGGIRSGLDVLKAVGVGAQATMIGRPWAYALAAGGQQAVEHMLSIIKDELRIGMALTGHTSMTEVDQSIFA